jgi:hypothetical protein
MPNRDSILCDDSVSTQPEVKQFYARGALDISADPHRLALLIKLEITFEKHVKRGLSSVSGLSSHARS